MEATLNITVNGQNGTLPDPLNFDLSDAEIKRMATEVVQTGGVPGITADPTVNFTDFVVDRFAATGDLPNRLVLRPKTPFGVAICQGCDTEIPADEISVDENAQLDIPTYCSGCQHFLDKND